MAETKHERNPVFLKDRTTVEGPEGIHRTTIAFNEQVMLCHFRMKAGASIPLHSHPAAQNGYVVSGRIRFLTEDGGFVAEEGSGYVFDPHERHGAEVLGDAEVIECFAPKRPEYEPEG
jgi:quercetin dioxygenase-like cupin family protein